MIGRQLRSIAPFRCASHLADPAASAALDNLWRSRQPGRFGFLRKLLLTCPCPFAIGTALSGGPPHRSQIKAIREARSNIWMLRHSQARRERRRLMSQMRANTTATITRPCTPLPRVIAWGGGGRYS